MVPESAASPVGRPPLLGARSLVLMSMLACGVWAYFHLDLHDARIWPAPGGWDVLSSFFSRAFSPALDHETAFRPTEGFLAGALGATWRTLLYAAAAMALSLTVGVILGFFASTAWWSEELQGGASAWQRVLARTILPVTYAVARTTIAFMRSIHELLWAMLLLLAFPTKDITAVVAIAIPYAGTLAKIFSEMIDEAPRGPARALQAAGASGMEVFAFGLLPVALPDMLAYAFYRFECALRSAAILGFFGFDTLGRRIKESFNEAHYGETWTFLYLLLVLVILFDRWSGAIRKRMVAG
jgi:phosphonate transport system permease protein